MAAGAAVAAAIAAGGALGAGVGFVTAMFRADLGPSGAMDALVMIAVGAGVGAMCGGAAAAQLVA